MGDRDEKGRFVPGSVANPAGRPKKGQALTDLLRLAAEHPIDGKSKAERLTDILWAKALDGDMAAIKYLYDRIDGQPIATQEQISTGGTLEVVINDRRK